MEIGQLIVGAECDLIAKIEEMIRLVLNIYPFLFLFAFFIFLLNTVPKIDRKWGTEGKDGFNEKREKGEAEEE